MPINSIHNLNFQGEFCSVPCSISLAYKQLGDDPVGVDPGINLIQKWFDEPAAFGGAWRTIRPFLSDELGFACATDSYDNKAVSAFLTGATGLNTDPATPSPLAMQIEVPPQNPHPNAHPGRFFMPGLTNNQLERAGIDQPTSQAWEQFFKKVLEVEDLGGGQGPRYHLIPHPKFLDRAGSTNDVLAYQPFANLMVKVVGSRRSDTCQAFLSGGDGGGFDEIIVPPTEPAISVSAPLNGGSSLEADPIRWAALVTDFNAVEAELSIVDTWATLPTFLPLLDKVGDEWERPSLNSNWLGVGTHTLYANARNAEGVVLTSEPITYTVT